MELTADRLIGFLASGTVIGILMSYLAKRKGWSEWRWMIAGWIAGAFLGAVVGGLVIGLIFYLVRAYEKGKAMQNGSD